MGIGNALLSSQHDNKQFSVEKGDFNEATQQIKYSWEFPEKNPHQFLKVSAFILALNFGLLENGYVITFDVT